MIPDKEPVNTWSGNSSNMTFDFDFLINSEDELLVLHTNKAGVQTALKLNIDYTIHQTGNADGSYIIFPILGSSYKTLGEGEKITLMLDIPIAQNSPYGTSDKLNLKSLEFSLDYIVRLIQMVNRKAERSVKVQEGSSVTPDDLIESLNQAQINANNSAQQAAASASSASYYAVTAAEEAAVAAQKTAEISEIAEELEALDFADPDLSNITNAGKQVIRLNGGSFVPFCVNSGAITDGTESLLSEANNTITAQAPFTITSASGITKKITENLSLDVSTCEPGQYEVMFDFDTSSLFLFSGTIHTGKKFPENAQTGDILFDISCAPYSSRKLLDDGTVKIECARIGLYDCVSGGGANSLSTYAYNENEINKPASSYLTQSQVTNCVLESPRKINVEINSDGQLVLKAGSVVVYPDSATKTFKEYTTTRDYVSTGFNNRQQTLLLAMQGGEETWGTLDGIAAELYCSSTTPVISGQYAVWLNLETFETKYTNNSGSSWQSIRYSMPFVIATCSASAYTSIDSVLDNFTFFGTYLMVRDDVKVLAPSGRNQDGTLNNKLITSVMSGYNYDFNGTTDAHLLLGNEDNSDNGGVICVAYYDYSYNSKDNTIQLGGVESTCALCGEMKIVNSRITYLKEKETLRVGDSGPVVVETYHNGKSGYRIWSDGFIEQWGMGVTVNGAVQIALPKSYTDTNYSILTTGRGGVESFGTWVVLTRNEDGIKTTSTFNVYSSMNNSALSGNASFWWYTRGY